MTQTNNIISRLFSNVGLTIALMKTLNFHTFQLTASISLLLTCVVTARADFSPVELTADSYNQDMVVESNAMHEFKPTTAAMDGGTGNYGDDFFEQGLDSSYPSIGFPVHGSTITSLSQSDHSFTLPASYATNDAILIDSTVTNATFTLGTPAVYSALSFLGVSGSGSTAVNVVVHHLDGTTDTGYMNLLDWMSGSQPNQVFVTHGNINVVSLAFDNENKSDNPCIYSFDLTLTNTASEVTSIDLSYNSGSGHGAIFAVSGSTGASFTPVAVSGYNEDMIVESNSYVFAPPVPLDSVTADLGSGTNLTSVTWYEKGYNTTAPDTGLPAPGLRSQTQLSQARPTRSRQATRPTTPC